MGRQSFHLAVQLFVRLSLILDYGFGALGQLPQLVISLCLRPELYIHIHIYIYVFHYGDAKTRPGSERDISYVACINSVVCQTTNQL